MAFDDHPLKINYPVVRRFHLIAAVCRCSLHLAMAHNIGERLVPYLRFPSPTAPPVPPFQILVRSAFRKIYDEFPHLYFSLGSAIFPPFAFFLLLALPRRFLQPIFPFIYSN